MAKVIAVCGKGGVGKTTVSGLIVRLLKEKGISPILAVDADPSMNLNITLGVSTQETVGNIREEAKAERPMAIPAGMIFLYEGLSSIRKRRKIDRVFRNVTRDSISKTPSWI